jgi:hypothetical protein
MKYKIVGVIDRVYMDGFDAIISYPDINADDEYVGFLFEKFSNDPEVFKDIEVGQPFWCEIMVSKDESEKSKIFFYDTPKYT